MRTLLKYCRCLAPLVFALAFSACDKPPETKITAMSVSPEVIEPGRRAEVRATVVNPADGSSYRWGAERGDCDPKTTQNLSTIYTAPQAEGDDTITLRVMSSTDSAITESAVHVQIMLPPPPSPSPSPRHAEIVITLVPPRDCVGGPDTHEEIAGTVRGVSPSAVRVILYAKTVLEQNTMWYIQPLADSPYTEVTQDNTWKTWTHTGCTYAALLVTPAFQPRSIVGTLPPVGGPVLALTVVEGR